MLEHRGVGRVSAFRSWTPMSSKNVTSDVVSVDEQAFEKADEAAVDEDGFEVVDETPEFRATVQMEVQAKVDSNHPDARVEEGPDHMFGKTLTGRAHQGTRGGVGAHQCSGGTWDAGRSGETDARHRGGAER